MRFLFLGSHDHDTIAGLLIASSLPTVRLWTVGFMSLRLNSINVLRPTLDVCDYLLSALKRTIQPLSLDW